MANLRDALVGQVLMGTGRVTYHLRDCVGEGGQGWAFRAHWNDPQGVMVLAKVLRPDTVSLEALRRFQQEAEVLRMLSMLPNPHVVRFYDHAVAQVAPGGGTVIAIPFTVLEFVNGPSLDQVLKSGALPVQRVRRILRHVSQGLETVHQQKVVHRDLKPSNILLSTEGGSEIAKVTDFGLVKLAELNLVSTTALAGASLGYAPPEQYERGNTRVSPRTDVFALAAVAYEMLSGKPAFPFGQGENPLVIVTRILNGVRPQLARLGTLPRELARRKDLLHAVDHILARALSPDPAHRHESTRALVTELEAALAPLEDLEAEPRSLVSPFEVTSPSGQVERSFAAASIEPAPAATATAEPQSTLPYGQPHRFPESVASQPASWRFTALASPPRPLGLRGAALAHSGEIATLGAYGVVVWDRGRWRAVGLPPELDPRAARGLLWLAGGALLVYGDALAVVLPPQGPPSLLRIPQPGLAFHGARQLSDGSIWLVGASAAATGIALLVSSGGRVEALLECPAVSRLTDLAGVGVNGNELLACGDRGAIVRCSPERAELVGNLCHGHLLAIAAMPDGTALTVGAGGHALAVNRRLEGALEAVQTTRDLLCLSVTADGSAWAGAGNARVLRRTSSQPATSWLRMAAELPSQGNVVGVRADEAMVRAVLDDGTLVEGRITS